MGKYISGKVIIPTLKVSGAYHTFFLFQNILNFEKTSRQHYVVKGTRMTDKCQQYISDYLKTFIHSSPDEIEFIRPHIKILEYKKKDFFLNYGDVQTEMGFVNKGLLRRYYINQKGNEITTGFIKENEYATDYPAFIRQIKTKYYMQCLEPTRIMTLPYEIIQKSYENFHNGQLYGRLVSEKSLTIVTDRLESFFFNTAEERYLKFIEENQEIMQRISLTHLASYLGIERQSLSRIRQRLSKK